MSSEAGNMGMDGHRGLKIVWILELQVTTKYFFPRGTQKLLLEGHLIFLDLRADF
jgi:hypothetical protein